MANQILNTGIYLSLLAQLDKLARHNRQGSFRTKERYYEAMKRFCAFLADAFRLQKLSNINGKHLTAYILKLQDDGKAPSTIKTDLAAIRFFHDLMDAKYKLPDNEELKVALQRRTFGGVDRTWSREEFSRMLAEALRLGREDYVTILYLARYAGLRIHECFRIDTAIAAQAVREGAITIKGKGGQDVPYIRNPTRSNRVETPLFIIGVDAGKALLYQRLKHSTPGPNYCHFPLDEGAGYDEAYFMGLTAEKAVVRFRKGRSVTVWEIKDGAHKRNEPLDLRNYATAALEIANPRLVRDMPDMVAQAKRPRRRQLNRGI